MKIAYIDSQNVKLGVRELGREIDRERFFVYIKQRYVVDRIKFFVGYIKGNEEFYDYLRAIGYTVCFKSTYSLDGRVKGNVDTLLMKHAMNDLQKITQAYLISGDGDFDVIVKVWRAKKISAKVFIPNHQKVSHLIQQSTLPHECVFMHDLQHIIAKDKKNTIGHISYSAHGHSLPLKGANVVPGDDKSLHKKSPKARDFADKKAKIYIAGHRGLVGSALLRQLQSQGYTNVITRTHAELDLTDNVAVADFFASEKPEYVFLAAAKVGGIVANNTYPADFLYQNLQIQNNVIHQSYLHSVRKLLFLGSSCIYPKSCPQPMKEEYLLTGPLEPTNEPYAIAKISGIKMCQSYNRQYGTNYIACMPTNLYGSYDNFDLQSSHVMPALIRKFHEAKVSGSDSVVCWGDGTPMREFLYVDDMADACIHLMNQFNPTKENNESGDIFLNIGTGKDIMIKDLAELVKEIVGFEGVIVWDTEKPNGTVRKLQDVSRLHAQGWKHTVELEEGVKKAYEWFLDNC